MYLIKALVATSIFSIASSALAASGMPEVIKSYGHPMVCEQALIKTADVMTGVNTSKLYIDPASVKSNTPVVNGVVNYQDRTAAISLHALRSEEQQCTVVVQETFVMDDPCVSIREDVFRKWGFVGKLDDKSSVLKKKESAYQQLAYLSDAVKSRPVCLVHIHREVDGDVSHEDLKLK